MGDFRGRDIRLSIPTPPFASATVNGTSLAITFAESLAAASNLANDAFDVTVAGSTAALTGSPSIAGSTVTLTLGTPVLAGQAVTVAYTKPSTGSNNKLVDTSNNEIATFSAEPVRNETPAPAFASATVNGASLVITFDKDVRATRFLPNGAFVVKAAGSRVLSTNVPTASGRTVTLTLVTPVVSPARR